MKKLIPVFLAIISMLSFFILFSSEEMTSRDNMEKAEQKMSNSISLLMPSSVSNITQTTVYEDSKKILDKYKADIYYTRYNETTNMTTKYVYLSNFDYFKSIKLDNGRFLTSSEIESYKFLSSEKTGDDSQVGTISTFAGTTNFEIRTLNNMVKDNKLFDGYCTVVLSENVDTDLFIKDLEDSLKISGIQKEPIQNPSSQDASNNKWIIACMYFIIMLLVLYDILKSYKKIGVEKLLGFSVFTIWFKRIISLVRMQASIIAITFFVMIIIKFKVYNQYFWIFLMKIIPITFIQIGLLCIICSIPFLYVGRIKISNMIKNKQPTKEIMIFNFFVKSILVTIFIIIINQGLANFSRIQNVFTTSYKQWEDMKSYAVLPNLYAENMEEVMIIDPDEPFKNSPNIQFQENQKKLYCAFNKNGAILANFNLYVPAARELRASESKYAYERDNVTVNPNYLKKYPVYDTQGNEISISETDTDYIVLIPDKYKPLEDQMRKLYQFWKNANSSEFIKNQPIKIIWIKSNQKMFSVLMDVNPNEGNYVTSPIITVRTECNGAISDYDIVIGAQGNPVKIKVEDPANPGQTIIPILKQFGSDKYVKTISNVTEQIAAENKQVKELLQYLLTGISILGLFILIIIIQNILSFFEQYKQHIVIRQLHGYKRIHKYKEYFLLFAICWVLIIISVKLTGYVEIKALLMISLILFLLELALSLVIIGIVDKRKVIKIIKGG